MANGKRVHMAKSLRDMRSRAIGAIGRGKGIWQKYTYHAKAGSREYFVYTPANYQPGTAVPLLVMLHGCDEEPREFAVVTQMHQLADQKQFIVVYPRQTSGDNALKCWNWFEASNQSRGSRLARPHRPHAQTA